MRCSTQTNSHAQNWLRYFANYCGMLALTLASVHAGAQTLPPSYVGPFDTYIYDYGWYRNTTEDAMIAMVEARINSSPYQMSISMCGQYKWLKNNGDWTDDLDSKVAGTVTKQKRIYGAQYYDHWVDNGADICRTNISQAAHSLERRRLVCPPQTIFAHGECVTLTEAPPLDDANNGPSCPDCTVGQPINPATGNMWHVENDYSTTTRLGQLVVKRTYNSMPLMPAVRGGIFGQGWTTAFDVRLEQVPLLPEYSRIKCWIRSDNQERVCPLLPAPSQAIPDAVAVYRPDGKSYTFQRSGATWNPRGNVNERLTALFDASNTAVLGWYLVTGDGRTSEKFDFNGLRTQINYAKGGSHKFTYATVIGNDTALSRYPADSPVCNTTSISPVVGANRLLCVTDNWGRQLNFQYDHAGRLVKLIDPEGQATSYEYDGASTGCEAAEPQSAACAGNVLTKVTYPGGKSRSYIYNEVTNINGGQACTNGTAVGPGRAHLPRALTGLVDETDTRLISWTYNCDGRATSSQLVGGVERVSLSYEPYSSSMKATVTHDIGDPVTPQKTIRTFTAVNKLGVYRNDGISGVCVECGSVSYRRYDTNGNILQANNFNGPATFYTYNSRNLEVERIEGWGYSDSLVFTTAWHATFRLPVKIAGPKLLTTFTYDGSGNLLTKTEQASTDPYGASGFNAVLTGSPRTWTYTYNAVGQLLTERGPRTDVVDLTTYEYDPLGNLWRVTNAAGHKTILSDYDVHGHVGRIEAPNGSKTSFTYTPRGWLESTALDDGSTVQTTRYAYDDAGKMTRVSLPNGAWMSYTYDDAHRLTNVEDHTGNKVSYTLDLTGNRLREQVSDPNGNLRRQIIRVFDTMNRVRQQTGGVQ